MISEPVVQFTVMAEKNPVIIRRTAQGKFSDIDTSMVIAINTSTINKEWFILKHNLEKNNISCTRFQVSETLTHDTDTKMLL